MNKDDLLIDFGQRLREARIKKGMTQQELADLIGTSKSVISGYENGKNDPARSVLLKLSKNLDVSLNYLMGWEEDTMEPEDETSEKVKVLAREAGDLSDVQIDLLRSMIQQFKEGKR